MARKVIEFHHVRVNVKAFDEWFGYEYEVRTDHWDKYEAISDAKNISILDLPDDLYHRLRDDPNEERFYWDDHLVIDEINARIVNENCSWQYDD